MTEQGKVARTLIRLGLSEQDAQVYIFLAKQGPHTANGMIKSLGLPKQTLYRALRNLESRGIITSTLERPAKFNALSFEKVLDLFVRSKMEEALRIREDKKNLLEDWRSISFDETIEHRPRFMVLEGRNYIYPHLKQMIQETEKELLLITSPLGLIRAEQYGLLETAFQHSRKAKVASRYLAEITPQNARSMGQFLERIKSPGKFQGRSPNLGWQLTSRMLIKDNSEVVFFINKTNEENLEDSDDICLWTNSSSIVTSFKSVFENLWHNSTDIQSRIMEIQKGARISNSLVIHDSTAARIKFEEAIDSAKNEIMITTSSSELAKTWRNLTFIKDAAKRGVAVKFLAPITRDGLEAVADLSSCCQVKHVAFPYLETTIVDGEHLFQFNNSNRNHQGLSEGVTFENTTYTNDRVSVQKSKNMLDEIWRNAISPGNISIADISKPFLLVSPPVRDDEYTVSRKDSPYQKMTMDVEENPGYITEEEVLNKILNPKKTPGVTQRYGSSANVVIHPPKCLNLPDMIFNFNHCSKQSTFGDEDYMVVYQWLESEERNAYVPAAILGDNAESLKHLREISFARTPAAENTIKVEKDQLQIQTYGNRLFAGWTIPIELLGSNLSIPPASMLFEGYGKIKSATINFKLLSGVRSILEGNGLDAFVTFFLPNYKYAGPGTDGIFVRDFIMTTTYPSPQK